MVTLNHPVAGNTNWFTPVDTNWSTLEAALTFGVGRIPFSDGTTLVSSSGLFWDNSNSRLGINTTTPRRGVDILDTANPQLRLSYSDNAVYTDLQTNNAGLFKITPTGNVILFTGATPVFGITGTAVNQNLTIEFDESLVSKGRLLYAGGNGAGARYFGFINDAADYLGFFSNTVQFATTGAGTLRGKFDITNANFVWGTAALATNATDGFTYIPTCAGTPTGTPRGYTGTVPMVYDTTNKKFWIYDTVAAAWKGVVLV